MITPLSVILFGAIGLLAGVSAGIFGIGGGVVIVPALSYLAGFSSHRAIGTSLAVLLPPVGLAAVFEYYRNGNVDILAAVLIALGLLIGAWFGARFAIKSSETSLRTCFGCFLIVLGVYTVITAQWRDARSSQPPVGREASLD